MKKNLLKKQSRQAFTLIELSFVIIVISVIIAGMVSIMSSKIANEKARASNDNFNVVYQALGRYLLINKKLPCPASLTQSKNSSATYGIAISDPNCVAAGVYQSTSSTNLVYGMVPSRTLGLSADLAEDAYGSKIVYVVDKRLTTTNSNSFESNVGNSTVISITGGASVSNALFVLIGRGANKSGAYAANSSATPAPSSNADELGNDAANIVENTPPAASTSAFDSTFIQTANSSGFDDAIFYKTEEQMLGEIPDIRSVISCDSASSTESLYGTTVVWPKAYENQIVSASTPCPSPNWNGSVKYPTKKCGAKGVWESIKNPCTCSTGYSGASCSGCPIGQITNSDGSCTPITCTAEAGTRYSAKSGLAYSTGSGTFSCDAGYFGAVTYTCTSIGPATGVSGSCLEPCSSTGATIDTTTVPGSAIHIFTGVGTNFKFQCPSSRNVQVLVVAGGGGGSGGGSIAGGAGGGAGGLIYNSSFPVSTSEIIVKVGDGGAGGPSSGGSTSPITGSKGGDSAFSSLTAAGGGGGGAREGNSSPAPSGGSGGGGGISGNSKPGGSASPSGQGNAGGNNSPNPPNYGGGGGGGAGSVGQNGASTKGGDGGSGVQNSITGIVPAPFYAGGGGASYYYNISAGTNGIGKNGGGNVGFAGSSNTGGGGGGGANQNSAGGKGGSGIVIVRY